MTSAIDKIKEYINLAIENYERDIKTSDSKAKEYLEKGWYKETGEQVRFASIACVGKWALKDIISAIEKIEKAHPESLPEPSEEPITADTAVKLERQKIVNLIGQVAEELEEIRQGNLRVGSQYSADMARAQITTCEYLISEIKRENITEEDV